MMNKKVIFILICSIISPTIFCAQENQKSLQQSNAKSNATFCALQQILGSMQANSYGMRKSDIIKIFHGSPLKQGLNLKCNDGQTNVIIESPWGTIQTNYHKLSINPTYIFKLAHTQAQCLNPRAQYQHGEAQCKRTVFIFDHYYKITQVGQYPVPFAEKFEEGEKPDPKLIEQQWKRYAAQHHITEIDYPKLRDQHDGLHARFYLKPEKCCEEEEKAPEPADTSYVAFCALQRILGFIQSMTPLSLKEDGTVNLVLVDHSSPLKQGLKLKCTYGVLNKINQAPPELNSIQSQWGEIFLRRYGVKASPEFLLNFATIKTLNGPRHEYPPSYKYEIIQVGKFLVPPSLKFEKDEKPDLKVIKQQWINFATKHDITSLEKNREELEKITPVPLALTPYLKDERAKELEEFHRTYLQCEKLFKSVGFK